MISTNKKLICKYGINRPKLGILIEEWAVKYRHDKEDCSLAAALLLPLFEVERDVFFTDWVPVLEEIIEGIYVERDVYEND